MKPEDKTGREIDAKDLTDDDGTGHAGRDDWNRAVETLMKDPESRIAFLAKAREILPGDPVIELAGAYFRDPDFRARLEEYCWERRQVL